MKRLLALLFTMMLARIAFANGAEEFQSGIDAYNAGRFQDSAKSFQAIAKREISSGALLNLGNAQWRCGRTGEAIVAWEQALWLDPFNRDVKSNLRFARDTAQLESPELTWCEIASGWLPMNWWAWITGLSLWLAVAALILPGVLRWHRAAWTQAAAALGFGLFLLCIPAHFGTVTRINLGFVLEKETALRLTPTDDGDVITRLASGDPVRVIRHHGKFALVRTHHSNGWVEASRLGLISRR